MLLATGAHSVLARTQFTELSGTHRHTCCLLAGSRQSKLSHFRYRGHFRPISIFARAEQQGKNRHRNQDIQELRFKLLSGLLQMRSRSNASVIEAHCVTVLRSRSRRALEAKHGNINIQRDLVSKWVFVHSSHDSHADAGRTNTHLVSSQ